MKIGFIQFDPKFGDKEANLRTIERLVANQEADLLVLPEMCTTGYMVSDRNELISIAEPIDGPTVEALVAIAKKNNLCLIVGMAESLNNKIFSTAIVLGPDGFITKAQKA